MCWILLVTKPVTTSASSASATAPGGLRLPISSAAPAIAA